MKSFLKIFLLVSLLVTLLASTAAALSDKDYKLLLKDPAFAKADKELNKTWKETRKILAGDKDALERVRKAHMEWVKTGRDEEAKLWREQEAYLGPSLIHAQQSNRLKPSKIGLIRKPQDINKKNKESGH